MSACTVAVTGPFDDLRSGDVRFLQEAAKLGNVTVLLWSDALIARSMARSSKFPEAERRYVLQALRFVHDVRTVDDEFPELLSRTHDFPADLWLLNRSQATEAHLELCRRKQVNHLVIEAEQLAGFPESAIAAHSSNPSSEKKVIVTGCYDWFHSGHVRFFEEVSSYGDLYVVVGHDENIRSLKGKGHPLQSQDERRYMVGAVRFVKQ